MSEKESCFICLEETTERICSTCKCYAHQKCFYKYVNKNFKISGEIEYSNTSIMLSVGGDLYCPICNIKLKYNKPLTRNDTFYFRNIFLIDSLDYFFIKIITENNTYILEEYLNKICKLLIRNKNIVKKDKILSYAIKKNLSQLKDCWKPSNIYYYQIFDKQI